MRLGVKDWRVIEAFVAGQALDGHKLTTDGRRLDGCWSGGARIAEKEMDGYTIRLNDLGNRSALSVHRAIRGMAPPMQMADSPANRKSVYEKGRRIAQAALPHGRCEREGRCVEHEIDPTIGACR